MKKIIPKTLILSTLLVFAMACSAFAAETEIEIGTAVITDKCGFRSEPSADSTPVLMLTPGTVLPVYEVVGDYYRVVYNGVTGYFFSSWSTYTPHDFVTSYIGINGESFNCETGGTKESHCQNCSYVYSEEVPAGDHQLGYSVGISTDCDVDVENVTFCTICDWEEVEVIPAPGHILVWSIGGFPGQKFSCETGGIKFIRCSRSTCNYHTEELIPPGHDYQEVAKVEPTYHSSGTQTMQCSYCGHRDYITIPALVDDGMTEDFFFAGSNLHDWYVEIVPDIRPRFWLHFWRHADWYCSGRPLTFCPSYAFWLWRS